jgi:hypothetical protein
MELSGADAKSPGRARFPISQSITGPCAYTPAFTHSLLADTISGDLGTSLLLHHYPILNVGHLHLPAFMSSFGS